VTKSKRAKWYHEKGTRAEAQVARGWAGGWDRGSGEGVRRCIMQQRGRVGGE
jgi:hypothetical protein